MYSCANCVPCFQTIDELNQDTPGETAVDLEDIRAEVIICG